jgi:hypothetical protein
VDYTRKIAPVAELYQPVQMIWHYEKRQRLSSIGHIFVPEAVHYDPACMEVLEYRSIHMGLRDDMIDLPRNGSTSFPELTYSAQRIECDFGH